MNPVQKGDWMFELICAPIQSMSVVIAAETWRSSCRSAVDCGTKTVSAFRSPTLSTKLRLVTEIIILTSTSDGSLKFGEFPWMMALTTKNDEYFCGGSLIHPSVVLTSAHCFNQTPHNLRVKAGEWDTQTTKELFPHSVHEVERLIIHPDFGAKNLFNDVALLVLETPVKLGPHINTICLPPQDTRFDGRNCFATGWGKDKFGQEGLNRVNLKKVALPFVPLRECQDSLRTTKLGRHFKLHTSFMCAGGVAGVDTCTGKI